MALYQNYPYTDLQTTNLDYLLLQTKTNTENIETVTESAAENARQIRSEVLARQHDTADLQQQINGIIAGTVQVQDRAYNVNRKRKIIFLADNYAMQSNPDYCYRAASALGIPSTNRQVITHSGAGFYPASYSLARTFLNMLQGAEVTIDANTVTDIVVCGGAYDVGGDTSAQRGQIRSLGSYVTENYPNAKLWIMFATWRPDRTNSNDYINTYTAWRNGAEDIGAAFDYLGIAVHSTAALQTGWILPNTTGEDNLAMVLAGILAGGSSRDMMLPATAVTITPAAPLTAVTSNLITTQIANDMVTININGRLTMNGSTSITQTTWYDLGTVDNTRWSSAAVTPINVNVPAMVNFSNGNHYFGTVAIRIVGAKLQANFKAMNHNTGSWAAAGAIDTVQLLGTCVTLDAVNN